jgi:hypothetical protein
MSASEFYPQMAADGRRCRVISLCLHSGDIHWTPAGHALAAQLIAPGLEKQGLLDIPSRTRTSCSGVIPSTGVQRLRCLRPA